MKVLKTTLLVVSIFVLGLTSYYFYTKEQEKSNIPPIPKGKDIINGKKRK